MPECKIIAESEATKLQYEIERYLRMGWTLVNCFVHPDRRYCYQAVLVKQVIEYGNKCN